MRGWLWGALVLSGTLTMRAGEESRTLDAAGGVATNATRQTVVAACQFAPVGRSSSSLYVCEAGFLSGFLLHPELDADGDGIADEDDFDDDNDRLSDDTELTGTAFSPMVITDPLEADVDGDGMLDGDESAAGTNPFDAASLLRITDAYVRDGRLHVVWQSREGRTYELLGTNRMASFNGSAPILDTLTAQSGSGAWQETRSTSQVPAQADSVFLKVRIKNDE